MSRKHPNAGLRCPGHDYTARCIYHIVLNKASGVSAFSRIIAEPAPHARLSSFGELIDMALEELPSHFPFVRVICRCIMPDHLHLVIFIKEKTEIHLGLIIKKLKNLCYKGEKLFEDGYHDTFLSSKEQLQRMIDYVNDNPRRSLLKTANPGFFNFGKISDGKEAFEAFGNLNLLSEPIMESVRISRKFSAENLAQLKRKWLMAVRNDGVLVGAFVSESERKVRDWAIENGGALILLSEREFGERYKPSGVLFELCTEGRLLEVSIPHFGELSRADCLRMNGLAERISAGEFRLL